MAEHIGTCKLCLQERPLLESHIFPKFLFKPMLQHEGQPPLHLISTSPSVRTTQQFTGPYERMLCRECELKLSIFEQYAKKVMFDEVQNPRRYNDALIFPNTDYRKFKLFLLSLIFRADAASERPGFKEIDLGPHSEKIRKMILDEDPGLPNEYGCMLVSDPEVPLEFEELIIAPDPIRIDGFRVYRLFLNRMFLFYFVSNHNEKIPQAERRFLSESGDLPLIFTSGSMPLLRRVFLEMKKAGNVPKPRGK